MALDLQTRFNSGILGVHHYTPDQHATAESILAYVKQARVLVEGHADSFTGNPHRQRRKNARVWFRAWFRKDAPLNKFGQRIRGLTFRIVCSKCHILPNVVTSIPDDIWPYTRRALLDQINHTLPGSFRDEVCHKVLSDADSLVDTEPFLLSFQSVFGLRAEDFAEPKVKVKKVKAEKLEDDGTDQDNRIKNLLTTKEARGADTWRSRYNNEAKQLKNARDAEFNQELKGIFAEGLGDPLEFITKLVKKFDQRRREDDERLEKGYADDLKEAINLDNAHNIHNDRTGLLQLELHDLLVEMAKAKIGHEKTSLFLEEIKKVFGEISQSPTARASEAVVHETEPLQIPPSNTCASNPPNNAYSTPEDAVLNEDGASPLVLEELPTQVHPSGAKSHTIPKSLRGIQSVPGAKRSLPDAIESSALIIEEPEVLAPIAQINPLSANCLEDRSVKRRRIENPSEPQLRCEGISPTAETDRHIASSSVILNSPPNEADVDSRSLQRLGDSASVLTLDPDTRSPEHAQAGIQGGGAEGKVNHALLEDIRCALDNEGLPSETDHQILASRVASTSAAPASILEGLRFMANTIRKLEIMAVQQYTSDRGKSESLTSHPSASGRPQSLDEHNYDTSTGSNSGGIAQLRPTTSSAKEVASRQAIRTLMGISQFVEGNVNFLNFTLSPRELCSAFRLITGSRKYRAVGSTESPDGPIYFCPRDQGFSLLVIEQSPKMLGVKARNEIEGSNLCRFLEGFWEERQLNDQDLLRFEGSTEGTGVISDSAKCASTDATLFIGKDWDDMTVFTCEPPMYEFILRHTYQLRGISIP